MEEVQPQTQPQPQSLPQPPTKSATSSPKIPSFLLILLVVLILVLIGEGIYYFWLRKKPEVEVKEGEEVVFCPELDALVKQFGDAQREIVGERAVYTFEGKILGVEVGEEFATYQLDLGKEILLNQPQSVKVFLGVLPGEYFGREVARVEDLDLRGQELGSPLKMTLTYQKPCQLIEWQAVLAVPQGVTVAGTKEEYLKIAGQVLGWLDQQKDERGAYVLNKRCRVSGECEMGPKSSRDGMAPIWGRFQYYQATDDKEKLEVLTRDLETYTEKIPIIQNDFWNCKLMYDLWQSDLLSDWQKEAAEKVCWYSANPDLEEAEEPDLVVLMENRPLPLKNPGGFSSFGGEVTEQAALSSDYAARFLWKEDEEDLEKAKGFFNRAVNFYAQETSNNYLSGRWVLGIAALDLYQAAQEDQYLDFAVNLFEKETLEEICLGDLPSPNYCHESLLERTTAILFLRQLFEKTGEENYQSLARELSKKTVEAAFDAQGYEGFFNGDHAFNSFGRGADQEGVNVNKQVTPNGLMAGILATSD